MGRSERGPPDSSVERLRSLTEEEKSYYWKLYKKLGGRRRCLHISMVQQFLLRSKLESETITKILETAVIGSDEVDFESFCVACRLIAQAQELGFIGSVSDLPAKPPWFAEEQSAEGQQATEFDFEGVALGVESAGSAAQPTSSPLAVWDAEAVLERGAAPPLESSRCANDVFSQRFNGSAAIMEASFSAGESTDPRLARLEIELVKCRREIETYLSEKACLEDAASELRDRLQSHQLRRHALRTQLSSLGADSNKLFANVDFSRQQIEDLERLVALLREARSLYSKAELAGVGGLQPGPALAMDHLSAEAVGNLRRAGRKKLELQSKHQLVLASYCQAEHDRNDARKALEEERNKLARLQAERLQLCKERHTAVQEALKLAKDVGVSPAVLKELCGQEKAEVQEAASRPVQRSFAGAAQGPGKVKAVMSWTSFAGGS